jgi:TorA maturation chaperone TorD
MSTLEAPPESTAADLARECLYRFLSAAVAGPYDDGWARVVEARGQSLALFSADLLRTEAEPGRARLGPGELGAEELELRGLLAALRRPAEALRGEFDAAFGLVIPRECPPYETEYYPTSETFARAQQMADAAGFFRAFGLEPSARRPERHDHLSLELEFMAVLLMKRRRALAPESANADSHDRAEVCAEAERDFFRDHLAWWLPAFAAGLARKAPAGYLHALARVLAAFVAAERDRLGVPTPARPIQPNLIEQPDEQSGCTSCPLHT